MSPGPGPKMGPETQERPRGRGYIPARDAAAPGWPDRAPADDDHAVAAGVRPALLPGRAGGDLLHRGADGGRRGGARGRPGHQGAADGAGGRARARRSSRALDPARDQGRRRALRAQEPGPRRQARAPRRGRQGLGGHDRRARRRTPAAGRFRGRARLGAGAGADRRARDRGAGRRRREHRLKRRRRDQADQEVRLGGLKDELSEPPTCGHDAKSNDLVTLGKMLREHGFAVAENAEMGDDPAPGVHAENGFHYKCRHSGALDVNADNGPGHREGDHRRDRRRGPEARLPHDLAGGRALRPHPHRRRQLGRDRARRRRRRSGRRARGDRAGRQADRLGRRVQAVRRLRRPGVAAASTAGRRTCRSRRIICAVLDQYADKGAGPRVRLSAFEAAIVESGVHNLTYGDRDSIGVFQQRPWAKTWGTAEQIMDPVHAADIYVRAAIERQDWTRPAARAPAQLAQDVQSSGSRMRYDQVQMQALALMDEGMRDEAARSLACSLALSRAAACSTTSAPRPRPRPIRRVYGPSEATSNDSPTLERAPPPPKLDAEPGGRLRARRGPGRGRRHGRRRRRQAREPRHRFGSDASATLHWTAWDARARRARGGCGCRRASRRARPGARRSSRRTVELSGLKTCDGRRYFDHAEVRVDPKVAPSGHAAGELLAGALLRLRGPSAGAGAVAAQRARRAGDQLAAPAAGPGVDGLQQLLREPVRVGRDDDRLDHLARAPVLLAAGRRLDADQREVAERAR